MSCRIMLIKSILSLFFIFFLADVMAQEKHYAIGLSYGFGNEFKNKDYRFANHFFKARFNYSWIHRKKHYCELLVQPEINFASHQLLNKYFVTPEDSDYEEKRLRYAQMKHIHEYILSFGFLYRQQLSERLSLFTSASIGPMITDTDTERLSKGFAFTESLSLGMCYKFSGFSLSVAPNIRHTSNAGLQVSNAGFNTLNFECVFLIPL